MPGLLIRNADYVVTVDRDRRIITDGAVAIVNDRIAAVGKTADVAPQFPDAETLDGRGKLVMPGLVDTHIHNAQQLGRGLGDEAYSGPERLFRRLWVVESHMDAGDALCAARLCQLEMVAQHNGSLNGRLKAWFSMRVPVACSDDLLRRIAALAEKRGVGVIGHACENRDEIVASHLKYGMGDVARLEKLGLLRSNLLLLHMGWVDARELFMLQQRDVKVSLAPGATFHQAMGNISHGKAPEMLELGITVALGSDSAMSGNFLDTIRQTFLLVGGYHEARLDPKVIRPEVAVEMITINGARATLWDAEIGSLEVGKRADVTVLDIRRPEWQPVHNPIANLVYSAHGGCADTVIVDGNVLMRNGRVLTLNEADLYGEARDRARSLVRRAGLEQVAASIWPVV
ncbi:MAG: amidohydrolase family protein [Candidatus Rokubacteria bacterium]|nr:amidohydrolase family protein [Candidatus Rokubacteria bacterium]